MPDLYLCPVTFAEAARFVELHHRHHPPSVGHKFSLCAQSCGPIAMSPQERRRIEARGVSIPTPAEAIEAIEAGQSADCPALTDGRCSIYEDRPLICRLWGAVESMPCPHGCEVTPGLLMDAGAYTLIARSLRLEGDT